MNLCSFPVLLALLVNTAAGYMAGEGRGPYDALAGTIIGAIIGIGCGFGLSALQNAATRARGMKAMIPYTVYSLLAITAPIGCAVLSIIATQRIAADFLR
jgi:hypothetical protein